MVEAYEQKLLIQREMNLESWRQARLIAYTNCEFKEPRPSLWEFMPLPGDPTPAELQAMKDAEVKKNEIEWNKVLDDYKSMGILTENVIAVA